MPRFCEMVMIYNIISLTFVVNLSLECNIIKLFFFLSWGVSSGLVFFCANLYPQDFSLKTNMTTDFFFFFLNLCGILCEVGPNVSHFIFQPSCCHHALLLTVSDFQPYSLANSRQRWCTELPERWFGHTGRERCSHPMTRRYGFYNHLSLCRFIPVNTFILKFHFSHCHIHQQYGDLVTVSYCLMKSVSSCHWIYFVTFFINEMTL